MGRSVSAVGVRNLDGRFASMIKVKLACEEAKIDYPVEVIDYFNDCQSESEDNLKETMAEVSLDSAIINRSIHGYSLEINVSKIPKEVKTIKCSL